MEISKLKKEVKISDLLKVSNPPKSNEYFIFSPLRSEKTPSFKVNEEKNTWYDFGIGIGGSVIDLVVEIEKCDAKTAVKKLKKFALGDSSSFSFSPASSFPVFPKNDDKKIEIVKVQALQNRALLDYVSSRRINIEIAKKYLHDVYYKIGEKHYFGAGLKNLSGGWEIRNKYTKLALSPKSYSLIKSSFPREKGAVAIFEGMFDFLSALTYFNRIEPKTDIIVLNSLSMIPSLSLTNYSRINLFLDRDDAGRRGTLEIRRRFPSAEIADYSGAYRGYKDFNDFLIEEKKKKYFSS